MITWWRHDNRVNEGVSDKVTSCSWADRGCSRACSLAWLLEGVLGKPVWCFSRLTGFCMWLWLPEIVSVKDFITKVGSIETDRLKFLFTSQQSMFLALQVPGAVQSSGSSCVIISEQKILGSPEAISLRRNGFNYLQTLGACMLPVPRKYLVMATNGVHFPTGFWEGAILDSHCRSGFSL